MIKHFYENIAVLHSGNVKELSKDGKNRIDIEVVNCAGIVP
jgi:hypothetical protein